MADKATKQTYTATFADGYTISRNSVRPYSHAYRIVRPDGSPFLSGFATSVEKAERAGRAEVARDTQFYADGFSARANPREYRKARPMVMARYKVEVVPTQEGAA